MIGAPILFVAGVMLRLNPAPDTRFETTTWLEVRAASKDKKPLGSATIRMAVAQRLKKREPGVITWSVYIPDVDVKSAGALAKMKDTFAPMKGFHYDRTMNELGETKESSSQGVTATQRGDDVVFPKAAVEPGATWPGSISVNGKPVKVTYRFDGPATLDKVATYHLTRHIDANQPFHDGRATEIWIDATDGTVLRLDGTIIVVLPTAEISMDYKVQRITKK